MHALDIPQLLGVLAIILAAARLCGALAQKVGQPAVLGELIAGVLLGRSVLDVVHPDNPVLQALAEIGVLLLLFEIGLETDLRKLLSVGLASFVVAIVGVVVPFALGCALAWALGLGNLVAITIGAALTATSVGITARVLTDLGRLQDTESQIVLGAAIIDDVLGLIILAVVAQLTESHEVKASQVARITGVAVGFLVATLLIGRWVIPPALQGVGRVARRPGALPLAALVLAFGLAWLAAQLSSAVIIGSFAAGLLMAATPQKHEIERGVTPLGHFFVPMFFVNVGAAVDLRSLNPAVPDQRSTLLIGILLIVVAILGKFVAGYAPFWYRGRKAVIGVGMIPRGEVGLIFGERGLHAGVLNAGLFSAVTLMVMVTTLLAPPLLKFLLPPLPSGRPELPPEGVEELVTEP